VENNPENNSPKSVLSIRQSLAGRLLTIVFSLYVLIAILMTVIHMLAEYEKTKTDVIEALKVVHEIMSPNIAIALWDLDNELLNSTVSGISNLPDVGGVKVMGSLGSLSVMMGITMNETGETKLTEQARFIDLPEGLYAYSAAVTYKGKHDQEQVGNMTIYAESGAVIKRIGFGFMMIIINAVIKTVALWVIFLWVSQSIIHRPLSALIAAVNKLDIDNIHCQDMNIDVKGKNELGALQSAFNNMIHKIRQSKQALKNANLMLEQKVQERTVDLNQKNRELERAYEKLEDLSSIDPLTGWRNRRFLSDHIPHDTAMSIRRYQNWLDNKTNHSPHASDLIFCLVDLDHFKEVNDEFGHSAGDEVLKQFCTLMESICRSSDYCVRWGGEEFLIITRFVDRTTASELADRIIKLASDFDFDISSVRSIHRTCSLGFSCFPFCRQHPDLLNWSECIMIADKALYAAKNSGRNAWVGLSCNDTTYSSTRPEAQTLLDAVINHTSEQIERGTVTVLSSISDPSKLHWTS